VALLRPYRVSVTVQEALAYLDAIGQPLRLLALYKHFFPAEFGASKGAPFPVGSQVYSDKELEFFRLIDSQLFPLAYWFIDQTEDDIEERDIFIPVWPEMLIDPEKAWIGRLRQGWQLLFITAGMFRDGDLGSVDEEFGRLIERAASLPELTATRFQNIIAAFEGLEGPLRHVPMACRVIDQSTDCVWLDAFPDQAYGPTIQQEWSIEGVVWLRDEYETRQEITANVDSLLDWLEAGHENRVRLLEIWESALAVGPQDEEDGDGAEGEE
jgi:hypothetical protein